MTRRSLSLAALLALVPIAAAPATDRASAEDAPRHLFYLHGRIVQETQSARPVHPRFGAYELDAILDALGTRGFEVHGGIRPKSDSVEIAARRTAGEVRALFDAGVAPSRVTLLGASMGAAVAIEAAAELGEPDLRVALLGACFSGSLEGRAARGAVRPRGRFLSIREESDESTEPCAPFRPAQGDTGRLRVTERVVRTGLAHGFLYRPLAVWLDPVVGFARDEAAPAAPAN